VTNSTAEYTVSNYAAERIQAQLEVFDWLVSQQDPKVSRNPAGFLVSSIKSEYLPPKGFLGREEQLKREARAAERKRRAEEQKRLEVERELAQQRAKESAIDGFWQSLSDDERQQVEAEALALASGIQQDVLARGGKFAEATRKALLEAYALRLIQAAA